MATTSQSSSPTSKVLSPKSPLRTLTTEEKNALVVQLSPKFNERSHLQAAQMIADLATSEPDYGPALASAGAVAPLIRLMSSPNETMQRDAATCISILAPECTNRHSMAVCGALQAIVAQLLGLDDTRGDLSTPPPPSSTGVRTSPNRNSPKDLLVARGGIGGWSSMRQIAVANAIPPLIRLLSDAPSLQVKEAAASALHQLASDKKNGAANQMLMAASGAVPGLSSLLRLNPSTHALLLLTLLDRSRAASDERVSSSLVHLLASLSSNNAVKERAAWALRGLSSLRPSAQPPTSPAASSTPNQKLSTEKMIEARNAEIEAVVAGDRRERGRAAILKVKDSIAVLCDCLQDVHIHAVTRDHAAHCLANLSSAGFKRAEDVHHAIAASGAFPQLVLSTTSTTNQLPVGSASGIMSLAVKMLGSKAEEANMQAAELLGAISDDKNKTKIAASGAVPFLVKLLSSSSIEVQEKAAWSLACLSDSDYNKTKIVASGALPILVSLLNSSTSIEIQTDVCWTLANLAFLEENERLIVEHGALPPLISLLSQASASSNSISRGLSPRVAMQATWCLANLTANEENKVVACEAGALPPVISLLTSSPHPRVQERAAWALSNLTMNSRSMEGMLLAGDAIPTLIRLLGPPPSTLGDTQRAKQQGGVPLAILASEGGQGLRRAHDQGQNPEWSLNLEKVQEHAARTLGNLADSEFLRDRIGERGAIPPLVKILASSSNDETMGAAAYCLWNLSLSSTRNQEVIRGVPGVFNLLLRLSATVGESNEYLLNAVENVLWCIGGLLDEEEYEMEFEEEASDDEKESEKKKKNRHDSKTVNSAAGMKHRNDNGKKAASSEKCGRADGHHGANKGVAQASNLIATDLDPFELRLLRTMSKRHGEMMRENLGTTSRPMTKTTKHRRWTAEDGAGRGEGDIDEEFKEADIVFEDELPASNPS